MLAAVGFAHATNVKPNHSNSVNNAITVKSSSSAWQSQTQNTSVRTGKVSVSNQASPSATTADSNNASQTVVSSVSRQVASAASVAIMPTTVCAGTTAGGAQGASFGFSFGTSWTDENCMLLEQIRTVVLVLGETEIAAEMLCNIPSYRDARERLGKACAPRVSVHSAPVSSPDLSDPYIRARLGLAQ